jgi:hypothetical protein
MEIHDTSLLEITRVPIFLHYAEGERTLAGFFRLKADYSYLNFRLSHFSGKPRKH